MEGRLTGTLESTGDKTSSFIVEEVPDKIDRRNDVAIMKHDNMFLNLAYFSAINLVKENDHILDYISLQGPTPQPAFAQHLQFLQSGLTERQREAVTKALINDRSIPTIITGPAGTGKSLVLAEIGLQVAVSNRKVLYISPTNQGITNLYSTVRKLSEQHFQDKVRLLKLSSPAVQIGNDCDQCFRDDLGTNHRYPSLDEINLRDVIFATPTVALRLGLLTEKRPDFGCILIDELAYMTETEAICALAPFLKENREQNPKVVLAGDNKQLTYVPRSQAASLGGMTTDLMTRLMKLEVYNDDRYITHLVDNFRNDRLLISLLNHMIYENKIKCRTKTTSGKIVAVHTVSLFKRPINDTSAYNAVDAVTCLRLAQKERQEIPDKKVIILCLYKAQMALLTRLQTNAPEEERIDIVTAELVQGSQSDHVIL